MVFKLTHYTRYALCILGLLSLLSCGGSGDNWGGDDLGDRNVECPPNSDIIIAPDQYELTDASQTLNNLAQTFRITAKDEQGRVIRDAVLTLDVSFAAPVTFDLTAWGGANPDILVQLLDGVVPVDSPYEVTTNEYGYFDLTIRFKSGGDIGGTGAALSYFGTIEAFCGTNFDSIDYTISAS